MSKIPPWFELGSDALEIGAAVLPVGKHTCPRCVPESDGGDPEGWSVAAAHAQLVTLNSDTPVTMTFSGTWEIDWERVEISESGSQATCAARITLTTGQAATLEYEFTNAATIPKSPCLAIAKALGHLGSGAGGVLDTAEADLDVTENQVGEALCGSTGCTSGDFGAFNNDRTETLEATFDGGGWSEKICRTADGTGYRYTFTGAAVVSLNAAEYVVAYLYTGDWDEARWPLIPVPSDPEYTLSEETTAGTVRGAAIKCRTVSYEKDHEASNVTGAPGNCPSPAYSSDVTTGTTTGSISVTVSG